MILVMMLLCLNAVAERDTLGTGAAVTFVQNRGQWDGPHVLEAQLNDAAIFLEPGAVTVALREHSSHPEPPKHAPRHHAYRMHFVGAAKVLPEGEYPQPTTHNYFLGNNPARWQSGVPVYDAARYSDLYDGIDLELYGGEKALKYNFIVHAGSDPSQIVVEYEGTEGVEVTSSGALRIRTSVRDIMELKPYVFQEQEKGANEIKSRWRVSRTKEGRYRATVEVGDYDHGRDLVIDPVLIFSTYTGSTADNWGTTAAHDSHKNVYTAGVVFNTGYPVSTGAYQPTFAGGDCDVGIFKFDSTGSQQLYATYLGGNASDMPHSMYVNSLDELLVFGTTGSANFPTKAHAFQTAFAGGTAINYLSTSIVYPLGSDIFVSRLSSDGRDLQASTYVGGSDNDGLNYRNRYNSQDYSIVFNGNDSLYYNYGDGARGEIMTDDLNNVYVGSTTFSTDFPTTAGGVHPQPCGRQDGVVFKLDYNLRRLLWSTYLGGTKDDAVYSIDVDSSYNLLVCGGTTSPDFPTTEGSYQTTYGGGSADGFVSKFSYSGDRLMASTYLGDARYDQLYFVRSGRHDEVFLFGQSDATGPSTMIYNAGYSVPGAGMLLVHMNPGLSERRWSTLFGTPGRINLSPTAFAADICNRVYAAGWGRDFVSFYTSVQWHTAGTTGMETTPDAYSDSTDGQDFYLISLDVDANALEYATFFGEIHGASTGGADHVDGGTSRYDRLGTLYQSVCASCSGTSLFPTTPGAWSNINRATNRCNNALFRFSVTDDFPVAEFRPPATGCAPYTVQLHNTGRGSAYEWDFGDGSPASTEREPTHTYTDPGTYTITLIASMPHGCAQADTQQHTVQVLSNRYIAHPTDTTCDNNSLQIGVRPALGAIYHWTGDPVSDPTVANPWVDTTGTYILHTTTPGCEQVDTFRVHTYNLIKRWYTSPISCHDSDDGSVTILFGDDIDRDSVSISIVPPCTLHYSSADSVVFGNLPPTAHLVTVNGYNCHKEIAFTLDNPHLPRYEKEAVTALCSDSCIGSIHITYSLEDIPLDTLRNNLCPGTYVTQLIDHGCPLVDTTVIIRDHTLDSLRAWADKSRIYLGQTVGLHAYVHQDVEGTSFAWTPASDLNHPDTQNPVATPTDTLVCYTVTATTANGCHLSDSVCVHCTDIVCGAPEFIVPNAFTPNGDGINDRLCFKAEILADFHIAIFNRWGQCVYESDDASQCWNGTFRNAPCLPGVYTYTCHVRCHNGQENDFKGDITLIR